MSSGRTETGERILRAFYELLVESSDHAVGMGKIAKRAGVSRQAVYLHFASRAELLVALVNWTDDAFGLHEELERLPEIADLRERLAAALRIGADYEPKIHDVVLVLESARHSDDAARAAWEDRMEQRRRHYMGLLEEADAAGLVRPGIDLSEGADVLWNLSCPASYRNLVIERGWTHERWVAWIMGVVDATLFTS